MGLPELAGMATQAEARRALKAVLRLCDEADSDTPRPQGQSWLHTTEIRSAIEEALS